MNFDELLAAYEVRSRRIASLERGLFDLRLEADGRQQRIAELERLLDDIQRAGEAEAEATRSVGQSKYIGDLAVLTRALDASIEKSRRLERDLRSLKKSRSWRATRPVRGLLDWVRRRAAIAGLKATWINGKSRAERDIYRTSIREAPRDAWLRLRNALDLAAKGQIVEALQLLETTRYSPELGKDIWRYFEAAITAQASQSLPLELPHHLMTRRQGPLHAPFRKLDAQAQAPKNFPFPMTLPAPAAAENNWSGFAEIAGAHNRVAADHRVHVVYAPGPRNDPRPLIESLATQVFAGQISVSVFGMDSFDVPETLAGLRCFPEAILSESAAAEIMRLAGAADTLVYLSGACVLDCFALERVCRLTSSASRLVVPFTQFAGGEQGRSLFAPAPWPGHYPFRSVRGLNFALPAKLAQSVGPLDPAFAEPFWAGREYAFRLYQKGAYFAPVEIPHIAGLWGAGAPDEALYLGKCPNPVERPADGSFPVPKVSIYIPAYNASAYIVEAVNSILEQDFEDLEVCIADDGSTDSTLAVLERHFTSNPRVRWTTNPNGGIGYASNRAIELTRGLYIGQLDSDDRLKPGAVRRLVEHLDAHADVVCCYSSAERIDHHGQHIGDEYSYPRFQREKMMVTSIVHHFRMFRRFAWERTEHFREDIANAVDYDMFLKLSEVGKFHHIDEKLYQRRWHGNNTSSVQVADQTRNTYRVQREALRRMGLDKSWDVQVLGNQDARRVTYTRRRSGQKYVVFWPDYSKVNPYQRLLYGESAEGIEYLSGDINAAARLAEDKRADVTFHLHWLNRLLADRDQAEALSQEFLERLRAFKDAGGKFVWTIHNVISHDAVDAAHEIELSKALLALADRVHLHAERSLADIEQTYPVPHGKVRVARHGHYLGVYPDFVSRAEARNYLGIPQEADVILFSGQVRAYKGIPQLIKAFDNLRPDFANARLLIAGAQKGLGDFAARIAAMPDVQWADRHIDDQEMQLYFKAADFAVYPYRSILTSGSLLLSLGFGVPAIIPRVGMTEQVLGTSSAGVLYDADESGASLEAAIRSMLHDKSNGVLESRQLQARTVARQNSWQSFADVVLR